MNRRSFMKAIGGALVGLFGLNKVKPFPVEIPNGNIKEISCMCNTRVEISEGEWNQIVIWGVDGKATCYDAEYEIPNVGYKLYLNGKRIE